MFGFFQKTTTDGEQSFFRPLVEPINGRTVCDGRELATPDAECVADGRETQHHFKVTSHAIDEELPAVLSGVLEAGCCEQEKRGKSEERMTKV